MYRDSLKNHLNVGDIIVYGDQATNTHLGYIMKLCPTKVKIRSLIRNRRFDSESDNDPIQVYESGTCLRYANQLVKVTIPNLEIISREGD